MTDTSLACVCYVGQPSITKIQDTVRRLKKKNADARILLAFFATEPMPSMRTVGATVAGGSFGTALEAIIQAMSAQHGDATAATKEVVTIR
jgi:hypothetical protein